MTRATVTGSVAGIHARGARTGYATRQGFSAVELAAESGQTVIRITVRIDGSVWTTVKRAGRRIVHRELVGPEDRKPMDK